MGEEDLGRLIDFIHKAKNLKYALRFSEVEPMQKDTVAAHTWRISLMAYTLAHELNLDIDLGHALELIVVHDIGEIEEGDIDTVLLIQGKISKEEKKERETNALNKLRKELPSKTGDRIYKLWLEVEEGVSKEARFILALDKMEATIQIIECGVRCIDYPDPIIFKPREAVRAFPELKDVYLNLLKKLKVIFEEGNIPWKPEYDVF